jgi:hypothetical protein
MVSPPTTKKQKNTVNLVLTVPEPWEKENEDTGS